MRKRVTDGHCQGKKKGGGVKSGDADKGGKGQEGQEGQEGQDGQEGQEGRKGRKGGGQEGFSRPHGPLIGRRGRVGRQMVCVEPWKAQQRVGCDGRDAGPLVTANTHPRSRSRETLSALCAPLA